MEELEKSKTQVKQLETDTTPEDLEARLLISAKVVFINNGSGNYFNSINSVISNYEPHSYNHTEQLIAILKAEIQKEKDGEISG